MRGIILNPTRLECRSSMARKDFFKLTHYRDFRKAEGLLAKARSLSETRIHGIQKTVLPEGNLGTQGLLNG